jgi:hypothetical protein
MIGIDLTTGVPKQKGYFLTMKDPITMTMMIRYKYLQKITEIMMTEQQQWQRKTKEYRGIKEFNWKAHYKRE